MLSTSFLSRRLCAHNKDMKDIGNERGISLQGMEQGVWWRMWRGIVQQVCLGQLFYFWTCLPDIYDLCFFLSSSWHLASSHFTIYLGCLVENEQMWSYHALSTSKGHCRAHSPNAPVYSLHPYLFSSLSMSCLKGCLSQQLLFSSQTLQDLWCLRLHQGLYSQT